MKMFAWWFESKAEEFKSSIKSYSLSEKSLKIPNFTVKPAEELLSRPEKLAEKEEIFAKTSFSAPSQNDIFTSAVQNLKDGLSELYDTAKKGTRLAEEGIQSPAPQKFLAELSKIDEKILHSEYKEIASLVFPTEKKLAALFETISPLHDEIKNFFQKSKIIYKELMASIRKYQEFL